MAPLLPWPQTSPYTPLQVLRWGFDPYIVKALMSALEEHGPELHATCSPKRLERDTATGKISLTVVRGGKEEVRGPAALQPSPPSPPHRPPAALLLLLEY